MDVLRAGLQQDRDETRAALHRRPSCSAAQGFTEVNSCPPKRGYVPQHQDLPILQEQRAMPADATWQHAELEEAVAAGSWIVASMKIHSYEFGI